MKIAMTIWALQLGGMETYLKGLGDYFMSRGHDVDFVEAQLKGRWSDSFTTLGYNVKTITSASIRSKVAQARNIAKVLNKYDVIFLNDAPFAQSILGLLRKEIAIIPVLHLDIMSFIENATGNRNEWDSIVTVSPGLRNIIIKHFDIPEDRVVSIPNSVEVASSWPKERHPFWSSSSIRVAYVGRMEHSQKGIFHLPGVFNKVIKKDADLTLEIIGEGPDLVSLKKMFSRKCFRLQVNFYGGVEHHKTLDLLSNCDVLILPSHFEGLPMVLLEAMALGVVPIVSNLTGFTDCVVQNGVNGFLVDVCDELGFVGCVDYLSQNRNRLKEMSRAAWETVQKKFSIEQTGEAYLRLISDIQEHKRKLISFERSGKIEIGLLGDLPYVPAIAVRPIRKVLRMIGLWPSPAEATQHSLLEKELTSLRSCTLETNKHCESD